MPAAANYFVSYDNDCHGSFDVSGEFSFSIRFVLGSGNVPSASNAQLQSKSMVFAKNCLQTLSSNPFHNISYLNLIFSQHSSLEKSYACKSFVSDRKGFTNLLEIVSFPKFPHHIVKLEVRQSIWGLRCSSHEEPGSGVMSEPYPFVKTQILS